MTGKAKGEREEGERKRKEGGKGPDCLWAFLFFVSRPAFKQLRIGQYANSRGNRAYCYAELAVFS